MAKIPKYDDSWPSSWRYSYPYDLIEIGGEYWRDIGYYNAYSNRRNAALELIKRHVPHGGRVLDVAAAQGNFSIALAESGYDVTWNDLRADLADCVRHKQETGSIHFLPGNVFDLAGKESFDGVLITEIIEHVAHPDQFLHKISELVRPGGSIVMTTPNGAYFRNTLPRFSEFENPEIFESIQFQPNSDGHIFLIWPDELPTLAEKAGVQLVETQLFTTPLSNGHFKSRLILPYLPKSVVVAIDTLVKRIPISIQKRLMIHMAAHFKK